MAAGKQSITGLQRQVLAFYRVVLRAARTRDAAQREPIQAYARAEFERYRDLDRRDFQRIEHLLRKGKKQLDLLAQTNVTAFRLQ